MISYLIKVTLIWGLLLLLFQLFYKKTAYYRANRLYLLCTLLAGLLIPLISLNLPGTNINSNPVVMAVQQGLGNVDSPQQATVAPAGRQPVPYSLILLWLYIAGAVVVFLLSIKEAIMILGKAIYGKYELMAGHKIFSTGREHAPFSFMGWIFISRPGMYEAQEINFILKHEDAHNRQKHWLDIIIMQLITCVCWFHPLVWWTRHLLKLEHEYEADAIAAGTGEEAYHYGHFLVQQTLLKGTPSIAHSFHYSPLKNRITMLTRNNQMNKGWKYAAAIPALLCCTLLMAKSTATSQRVRVGDKTTFMGNEFYWGKAAIDSIQVVDPVTAELTWMVAQKNPAIIRKNREKVYTTDDISIQPQFRADNSDFNYYLKKELISRVKNIPDSVAQIQVNNVVVDDKGKIVYCDYVYINTKVINNSGFSLQHPFLDQVLDKIIQESPLWLPAAKDGKTIPVYLSQAGVVSLKSTSMTTTLKGDVKELKGVNGDQIFKSDSTTVTFPNQKKRK